MNAAIPATIDLFAPWQLTEHVSLRDEEFGAMAYHHDTRRLVFLKSVTLVNVVRRLSEFPSAKDALCALVPDTDHVRYESALASLSRSEIICAR